MRKTITAANQALAAFPPAKASLALAWFEMKIVLFPTCTRQPSDCSMKRRKAVKNAIRSHSFAAKNEA